MNVLKFYLVNVLYSTKYLDLVIHYLAIFLIFLFYFEDIGNFDALAKVCDLYLHYYQIKSGGPIVTYPDRFLYLFFWTPSIHKKSWRWLGAFTHHNVVLGISSLNCRSWEHFYDYMEPHLVSLILSWVNFLTEVMSSIFLHI